MAEEAPMIRVIDHCRVSPKNSRPSSSPILINLSPFDIPLSFMMSDPANQVKRVIFYEFPNSHNDDNFIHQQLVPSLKTSLSLALQHFYPFASKLLFPPFPEIPRILYTDGDSVPFTIVESMMNFGELVGDQIKDAKLFVPLIPKLSPLIKSEVDGTLIFPDLLAIQVTVFPNSGMCIGIHYNHTVSDGMSLGNFLKSWASICRTGSAELETSLIPFLQRDVVEDGLQITTQQLLKEWLETFPRTKSPDLPSNVEVREAATFILSKTKIKQLKDWILSHQQQCPTLSNNISSFAAACAFTWVCYVKSKQLHGKDQLGHDTVQLWEMSFPADVRTRLKTPTPKTFFGNCIVPCQVLIEENVLLGQHGIVYAANAISDKVKELNNDQGVVERALETWLPCFKACQFERFLGVSGSPRQAFYDADFGWGRPKKCSTHINSQFGDIALAENRDEEGGLEIGMILKREAMNKFTTLFHSFI